VYEKQTNRQKVEIGSIDLRGRRFAGISVPYQKSKPPPMKPGGRGHKVVFAAHGLGVAEIEETHKKQPMSTVTWMFGTD
jgi:hypothetical protein